MESKNWTLAHSLGLIVVIVAVPLLAWWSMAAHRPVLGWLCIFLLILAFALIAGHGVLGVWRGVLIDQRNVISLSRFQMLVWTVIVLSAFLTAAFVNIYAGVDEPLAIQVPGVLWGLMGISTTSLVGTPLILSSKHGKQPDQKLLDDTKSLLQKQGFTADDTTNIGQVIANTKPTLARWSDMFTGDETSNGAHLDLSKVQMFFFTIVIAISYCALLWQRFRYGQSGGMDAFPDLDQSALALIGISHAGYLVNKATPRA